MPLPTNPARKLKVAPREGRYISRA
jgi:hypothetical protein